MKTPPKTTLVICAVALCAMGTYAFWRTSADSGSSSQTRKVLYYQDSMHPWIKSDKPAKCTVCAMDLTPILEGDSGFSHQSGLVVLNSNSVTVLDVQTETVKRQSLRHAIRVAGTLEANESRKAIFSAPAAGRIEEMLVQSVGDIVDAAQPLFTFYSPELATWRRAYVVRNRTSAQTTPYFAGRPHQGGEAGSRTKPGTNPSSDLRDKPPGSPSEPDPYSSDLLSPLSGVVTERKVFNGQYVAEGDRLLTIVDTSVLWFRFDVYEHQLPWLQKGQEVRVTIPAIPGHELSAVISVVEPTLDERTRTAKVRADVSNPFVGDPKSKKRLLTLGMYADGLVIAEGQPVLTVPRTAILLPGGHAYAYVEKAPGAYAMRALKVGRQGDNQWEVVDGLAEGERVVTSGNVLIDAQAQFNQSPEVGPSESQSKNVMVADGGESHSGPVAVASSPLTPAQQQALTSFLNVADRLSAALSSDNLAEFKKVNGQLREVLAPMREVFRGGELPKPLVEAMEAASTPMTSGDLAAARNDFLPFSTKLVTLVQHLRTAEPAYGLLQVYHCPMAPAPGVWFQAVGPLKNPYFGAKMLSCGETVPAPGRSTRVTLQASEVCGRVENLLPEAHPAVPATRPPVDKVVSPNRAAPATTVRTANTRNPEAKERMMRSFVLGLTERHRANAVAPQVEAMPAAVALRHEPSDSPRPRASMDDETVTILSDKK